MGYCHVEVDDCFHCGHAKTRHNMEPEKKNANINALEVSGNSLKNNC